MDSWQRQCYYYKRSASSLRGEADRLRSILQRNKIKIPSSAVSRPLQVHDEARLLEDLQSTEKSLASARHDVKSLSLEKRRLEFLLRAVRAKAGEQLRIAEAVNEQLQNELSESRETLRQVQELSLRGVCFFSTYSCIIFVLNRNRFLEYQQYISSSTVFPPSQKDTPCIIIIII